RRRKIVPRVAVRIDGRPSRFRCSNVSRRRRRAAPPETPNHQHRDAAAWNRCGRGDILSAPLRAMQETPMRNRFMIDPARIAALTLGFLAAAGAVVPASAASGTEVWREVNSYCKEKPDGSHNPCGAVAYGNGGGYAVAKVTVESRDNDWDSYPQCKDVSMSNSNDLTAGQYGVFVLPAPCEYKVTIKILAGDTKSNKLFLTPGCAI